MTIIKGFTYFNGKLVPASITIPNPTPGIISTTSGGNVPSPMDSPHFFQKGGIPTCQRKETTPKNTRSSKIHPPKKNNEPSVTPPEKNSASKKETPET